MEWTSGVVCRIGRLKASGEESGRSRQWKVHGSRHIRCWSCTVWLLSQKEKKDGAIDAEGRHRGQVAIDARLTIGPLISSSSGRTAAYRITFMHDRSLEATTRSYFTQCWRCVSIIGANNDTACGMTPAAPNQSDPSIHCTRRLTTFCRCRCGSLRRSD
jgi:hypothetical protein